MSFIASHSGVSITNMPAAATLVGGLIGCVKKADLTGLTQCRLICTKGPTAGAAASKFILKYATTFQSADAGYSDIGTSEVSLAINVQNTLIESSWIALATLALADVWIAVSGSGGDGALDPVVYQLFAQFK